MTPSEIPVVDKKAMEKLIIDKHKADQIKREKEDNALLEKELALYSSVGTSDLNKTGNSDLNKSGLQNELNKTGQSVLTDKDGKKIIQSASASKKTEEKKIPE
jgi:hypothetical protein